MVFSKSLFRESNRFKKLFITKVYVMQLECDLNHFILITKHCINLFHSIGSTQYGFFKKLFLSKYDVLPLECELNLFILITIRCRRLFQSIGPTQDGFSNSLFRESNRFKKLFLSKDDVLPLECELNHFI